MIVKLCVLLLCTSMVVPRPPEREVPGQPKGGTSMNMNNTTIRIIENESGIHEAKIFRPSVSLPFHSVAGQNPQEALERALSYAATNTVFSQKPVLVVCRGFVSIDPNLVKDLGPVTLESEGDNTTEEDDEEPIPRSSVNFGSPRAPTLQEWKADPPETQKEEISKLSAVDRDFAQSFDVNPRARGWSVRHMYLGPPIGTGRRSDLGGFTGKFAVLNPLLSQIEANREIREVFVSLIKGEPANGHFKCSERLEEIEVQPGVSLPRPKTMEPINGLWDEYATKEDPAIELLLRLKSEFEELQPEKQPKVIQRLIQDADLRQRFKEKYPIEDEHGQRNYHGEIGRAHV